MSKNKKIKEKIVEKIRQDKRRNNFMNWTKEQLQAIEEKDSNILVAAAARKWKDSRFSRAYHS